MRFCAVLAIFLAAGLSSAAAGMREPVDWPAFLGRHDLVWLRNPSSFGDSLFLGNGDLGATVCVRDGKLTWEINRADITHDGSRYPIGRLVLKTQGSITGGDARLVLWDAEGSGTVKTEKGSVHWRSFVATSPSVLVVELLGKGGEEECALDWNPAEARPPRKAYRKEEYAPEDLHPAAIVTPMAEGLLSVQTFIGGGAHAESIRQVVQGKGRKLYYVSIGGNGEKGTAEQAAREAAAATAAAESEKLDGITARHRAWWHACYPASFLSMPDARLEAFYWIQIYKLGAAMRSDGPILDLMGPWFGPTPWPKIWWNLNIQLTYSPLFVANRLEQAESLFRALDKNRAQLIANVPPESGGPAAAIGTASGYDLASKVDEARALRNGKGTEMGNLPWVLYLYWLDFRMQMDDSVLRDRVLPLLKPTVEHYLAFVKKGADGRWHLPTSYSPEYAFVEDCNYDLALLRWGLKTLVESCDRLRINDPELPRWKDVLEHLTPPPVDDTGLMIGSSTPLKESHRHYSHLLAIYPLHLLDPDRPDDRKLIETSLANWINRPEKFKGYSYSGAASMFAMLGDGDKALENLQALLNRFILPNTLYQEAGPVIETPLSAATSIQELFLQSWGDVLRIFPAVPSGWKDVSFARLRGEGAFLVSAVRKNGKTDWIRVESLAGAPCRIRVADWRQAVIRDRNLPHGSPEPKVTSNGDGNFSLDLPKGAAVVLSEDAGSELSAPAPAMEPSDARNPYPMRFH